MFGNGRNSNKNQRNLNSPYCDREFKFDLKAMIKKLTNSPEPELQLKSKLENVWKW